MRNEQLKRLIKEEIKNILKEADFTTLDRKLPVKGKITYGQPNTAKPGQEKLSGGDFNKRISQFLIDLRKEQGQIMGTEKKNVLDLFLLIVQKAREGNLTQTMEDRIKKILALKDPETPKV